MQAQDMIELYFDAFIDNKITQRELGEAIIWVGQMIKKEVF